MLLLTLLLSLTASYSGKLDSDRGDDVFFITNRDVKRAVLSIDRRLYLLTFVVLDDWYYMNYYTSVIFTVAKDKLQLKTVCIILNEWSKKRHQCSVFHGSSFSILFTNIRHLEPAVMTACCFWVQLTKYQNQRHPQFSNDDTTLTLWQFEQHSSQTAYN